MFLFIPLLRPGTYPCRRNQAKGAQMHSCALAQLLAAHSFVAANLWGSRANESSHRAASSSVPAGIVGGGESRELDLAIKLASSLKSNEGTAGYVGCSRSLARVFPRRVLWGVIKSETEERGIRRTRAVKGGAERACTVPIEMCDALVD